MKEVAIITYHSAYNFGSVLQAYATQQAVRTLGYAPKIVNYRMDSQKEFYCHLYRRHSGLKTFVKDLTKLPIHRARMQRKEAYEAFFARYLDMTKEVYEPEQAMEFLREYDIAISGSDQIWNKHSCEFERNEWRYMEPYLLKDFQGRKVSYASSVGNMDDSELQRILPEVRGFDALAFREAASAEKMSKLLNHPVETVLDPTFLLTRDEWVECLQLKEQKDERFILAYFLCGPKSLLRILPNLARTAKKMDCRIKLVTPFAYLPYPDKQIEWHPEYGPIEFLNDVYNAEAVITDSYHGTVLSVNFGKEFYSICKAGGAEFRKTDLLGRLGLLDRTTDDIEKVPQIGPSQIDYDEVYQKLALLRRHSLNYLKAALEE